jgi:hypothetical protein
VLAPTLSWCRVSEPRASKSIGGSPDTHGRSAKRCTRCRVGERGSYNRLLSYTFLAPSREYKTRRYTNKGAVVFRPSRFTSLLIVVRRWGRSYTLAAVLAGSSTVIAAQQLPKLEQETSFHIPAGSLESALIQFSRQTEIQIVVSGPVAKISVAAVEGRRNAREVLTTLLTSTGLTYTVVGETITVHGSDPDSASLHRGCSK